MAAGKLDITIEEGAQFKLIIVWRNSTGAVINTSSGYTARMKIRESTTGTEIDELLSGAEIALGASNIVITITGTVTAGYDFDWGVYDLEVELTSGTVITRLLQGAVKFDREVTFT